MFPRISFRGPETKIRAHLCSSDSLLTITQDLSRFFKVSQGTSESFKVLLHFSWYFTVSQGTAESQSTIESKYVWTEWLSGLSSPTTPCLSEGSCIFQKEETKVNLKMQATSNSCDFTDVTVTLAVHDGPTVCRHYQTGFCKFGESCRKQHVKEIYQMKWVFAEK